MSTKVISNMAFSLCSKTVYFHAGRSVHAMCLASSGDQKREFDHVHETMSGALEVVKPSLIPFNDLLIGLKWFNHLSLISFNRNQQSSNKLLEKDVECLSRRSVDSLVLQQSTRVYYQQSYLRLFDLATLTSDSPSKPFVLANVKSIPLIPLDDGQLTVAAGHSQLVVWDHRDSRVTWSQSLQCRSPGSVPRTRHDGLFASRSDVGHAAVPSSLHLGSDRTKPFRSVFSAFSEFDCQAFCSIRSFKTKK